MTLRLACHDNSGPARTLQPEFRYVALTTYEIAFLERTPKILLPLRPLWPTLRVPKGVDLPFGHGLHCPKITSFVAFAS
jgi:hypothetical protein